MVSKTIGYFMELSKIPRESGNEKMIADYIVNFAKERNLEYKRDEFDNVIIKKYVNDKEPIILQSHLDMVCVKENGLDFDFSNDSLNVYEDNGYLTAMGTSLGADNGIGVAQMLNILDNDLDISIEAIFTTNEETTMEGAEKIDLSDLRGKKMINLDGFDSDTILIESASFTDIDIHLNCRFDNNTSNLYKISLTGLEGGHSGFDINRIRSNSIIMLSNLLLNFGDIKICSFNGGTKINVIPSSSEAIISTSLNVLEIVNKYLNDERKKYANLDVSIERLNGSMMALSNDNSKLFLESLSTFKHGVLNVNERNEVTTSENLSTVDLKENLVRVGLRSSIDQQRDEVIKYLNDYCKEYGYELLITGYQPGFRTLENSKIVNDLSDAYVKINGYRPNLKSVHIGVEVGFIKDKIKDLEVAIISPNIIGAHSVSERVEIKSINKCDEWILEYLKEQV